MKLLKQLYRISSPSRREEEMILFIKQKLDVLGVNHHTDRHGNIYAVKGTSDTYPCVVCHTDEVHAQHPPEYRIITSQAGRHISGYDPKGRRHCGTGADDKNGIWVCLKCLEESAVLKCVFFASEEMGCVGSRKADMTFFRDCRFVIQCDRKGHSDMVTRVGMMELCSGEFIKNVHPQEYGYGEASGMLTDVVTLKERGLDISCVNLSCGYYYPHTEHEFTDFKDLEKCLDFVRHIIRDCRKVYRHRKRKHTSLHSFFPDYGRYCRFGICDLPEQKQKRFDSFDNGNEEPEEETPPGGCLLTGAENL